MPPLLSFLDSPRKVTGPGMSFDGTSLGPALRMLLRLLPLALMVFLASALWPLAAPGLRLLLSGISPQRPGHSLFLSDGPMPLEARMLGIFGGFAVALACLVVFKDRLPSQDLPGALRALSIGGVAVTGFDGINAFFWDMGMSSVYPPANGLRLFTGTLAGAGLGLLLAPYIALLGSGRSPAGTGWAPLLARLSLAEGCFVGAALSNQDALAKLSVLAGASGILALFWLSNGTLLSLLSGRSGHRVVADSPAAMALALAVGELLLLAFFRAWLQNRLGIAVA